MRSEGSTLELTSTIVICTRDRPDQLRVCLEAVARLKPPADAVLVVDNASRSDEAISIAQAFATCYMAEPIAGLSRARNRGLSECKTDIVAFLDDDSVPEEGWLGAIISAFEDAAVAVVTGRVIAPKSGLFTSRSAPEPILRLTKQDPLWFERATLGGLGSGNNMAFRKTACSGWTVFDERLGRGAPFRIGEENLAFGCILERGYTAVHTPAAVVVHPKEHRNVGLEARSSIAFLLLLFFEFSGHRLDLLRFLSRRLRRKPLTWQRNPQEPGELVTSGSRVLVNAAISGTLLYLRERRGHHKAGTSRTG
jgi:glycosyltransferase involved in cell wall biosynthesis